MGSRIYVSMIAHVSVQKYNWGQKCIWIVVSVSECMRMCLAVNACLCISVIIVRVSACLWHCVSVWERPSANPWSCSPGPAAGHQPGRGQLQADQTGPGPASVHRGEVRALGVQGSGPWRGHGRGNGWRTQEGRGGWEAVACPGPWPYLWAVPRGLNTTVFGAVPKECWNK